MYFQNVGPTYKTRKYIGIRKRDTKILGTPCVAGDAGLPVGTGASQQPAKHPVQDVLPDLASGGGAWSDELVGLYGSRVQLEV